MAQTLQEKLAGLEAQFKQVVDSANALSGAIQFCKQLISEEEADPDTPMPYVTNPDYADHGA